MTTSAWFIGSVRGLPATTLTIEGGPQVVPAGDYYLHDSTAALSLTTAIAGALTAAGVAGASVVLLRNRRLRISGAGSFSLTWPVGGVLRDLLGFTGNLAAASSYTAPGVSPLLFSPGRTESPTMAPLGVLGHTRQQVFAAVSAYDGSISTVTHGSGRVFNEFKFGHVAAARYQTAASAGGEWATFMDQVCARGASFNLWRLVDESDASSTAATLSTKLGPYVYSPAGRAGLDWSFTRSGGANFAWTDRRFDLSVPVHVVPEYDS